MKNAQTQTDISLTDVKTHKIGKFNFRFPTAEQLDQDEEWCEVQIDGQWRRFRFHDYHELYDIPGLYEALFYRRLKCCSPERVVGLLDDVMSDIVQSPDDLRVLDVGAGNGMVGEALRNIGAQTIVGVDIIDEARNATMRDRADFYKDYHVLDLTDIEDDQHATLSEYDFNCLTIVAALGYGDIPTEAFLNACRYVREGGWLAFTIKENFLDENEDPSGFAGLIRDLIQSRAIQVQAYRRYCHRLSMHGDELHYVAMVANKTGDMPE